MSNQGKQSGGQSNPGQQNQNDKPGQGGQQGGGQQNPGQQTQKPGQGRPARQSEVIYALHKR